MSGTLARHHETEQLVAEAAGFKQPLGQDPRWNEYGQSLCRIVTHHRPRNEDAVVVTPGPAAVSPRSAAPRCPRHRRPSHVLTYR
ncbi:hypothetical protein ACFY1B_45115 [Streptomyces mirabilis]|uniref:hypothetical protein n=1 Tax=Streptomyces mirabilis TaxID=68239 RepID=UPI0036871929